MKNCLNCQSEIPSHKKENKYCSRSCAATHTQKNGGHHKWSIKDKKKLSILAKQNPYFNGSMYHTNKKNKISKTCDFCQKPFETHPSLIKRNCCSRKCKYDWIKKTGHLKGKLGGYREGSGRSKNGKYKGIFCGSTYELAWAIYHLDKNIPFKRNNKGFDYVGSDNKLHKYYPDFVLSDNTYVEIKGYKEKEFDNKQKNFPEKIIVFDKEKLKPIFDYVNNKYRKNLRELFDN
jgi:hypothetical protein